MPYSAPWMTNRCRCSPPQPNAVCTMVCRSATVLSPETSSRRQISGLTACSTARNRYTPGDAARSDTTSPVGTSASGTARSSPLAMLATVVRVGAGGQRDRRPRRGGPAPRARDGRSAPAAASRHAGSGPAASVCWFPASASWVSAECRHFPRLRRRPPNGDALHPSRSCGLRSAPLDGVPSWGVQLDLRQDTHRGAGPLRRRRCGSRHHGACTARSTVLPSRGRGTDGAGRPTDAPAARGGPRGMGQLPHRGWPVGGSNDRASGCLTGGRSGSRPATLPVRANKAAPDPFSWFRPTLSTPGRSGWSWSYRSPPATGDSPTTFASPAVAWTAHHSPCPSTYGPSRSAGCSAAWEPPTHPPWPPSMTGSDASLACSSPGSPPPKCPALRVGGRSSTCSDVRYARTNANKASSARSKAICVADSTGKVGDHTPSLALSTIGEVISTTVYVDHAGSGAGSPSGDDFESTNPGST